jgi:hypothetical protein
VKPVGSILFDPTGFVLLAFGHRDEQVARSAGSGGLRHGRRVAACAAGSLTVGALRTDTSTDRPSTADT